MARQSATKPIKRPRSPFTGPGMAGVSDVLAYVAQLERYASHLERELEAARNDLPLFKQERSK